MFIKKFYSFYVFSQKQKPPHYHRSSSSSFYSSLRDNCPFTKLNCQSPQTPAHARAVPRYLGTRPTTPACMRLLLARSQLAMLLLVVCCRDLTDLSSGSAASTVLHFGTTTSSDSSIRFQRYMNLTVSMFKTNFPLRSSLSLSKIFI